MEVLVAIHDVDPAKDGVALKKACRHVGLYVHAYISMHICAFCALFKRLTTMENCCVQITDACTACFEQRTVFTQHVLAKSLSHMV